MNNEKIAYASAFASFLLERISGIRTVVLFGSVSRGGADRKSDIDIFVDTISTKITQKEIDKAVDSFYESQVFKSWKLKGIENPIAVVLGNLEGREWADLKRSIITDGLVLFGKYKSVPDELRHYVIFSYSKIEDAKKRVNLHRKLFGYKVGNKRYYGIVQKSQGLRHGSGSFSIPIEHYKDIEKIFRELKITPQIKEMWIE